MYNITNPTEHSRQAVLPIFDILPAIAKDANFKIGVDLSYIPQTGNVSFPKKRRKVMPESVYIKLIERDLRNG